MLAIDTFLARQHVTMDIRDHHVGIDCQLGLKAEVKDCRTVPTELDAR